MARLFATIILAALLAAGSSSIANQRTRGAVAVTIRASQEMAPPGGMAQMKIRMTDLQPIITGRARFSFPGMAGIEGLGVVSPGDDAVAMAVVRGTDVALSIVSPGATLGTDPDYPLVTVVGRVPIDAPLGATFPLVLDAGSLQLVSPSGVQYATEVDPGELIAASSVTIHEVLPGSATLAAGSRVKILGSNFQRDTEMRFDETGLAQVLFVSPTQIDVVLGESTRMHGLELEARNRDGSRSNFFSYQRTSRAGKVTQSVMRDVVPIFHSRSANNATLHLSGVTTGVALQNVGHSDAVVTVQLVSTSGAVVAATKLTLPSNTFLVRELAELFRVRNLANAIVRVSSATPVQVLGVSIDSAGAVSPLLPQ